MGFQTHCLCGEIDLSLKLEMAKQTEKTIKIIFMLFSGPIFPHQTEVVQMPCFHTINSNNNNNNNNDDNNKCHEWGYLFHIIQ